MFTKIYGKASKTSAYLIDDLAPGDRRGCVNLIQEELSCEIRLMIGDRWYDTRDNTEKTWNGTYWANQSPI